MANFWKIFELILGVGETVVPIFIHNPKSQAIEGVVVTTLNEALAGLQAGVQAQSQASSAPPVTPVPTPVATVGVAGK
jgi:hypothetical protein